jgi:outer membrane protein OmpA-like peptidoglycan-associated protein
MQNRHLVLFALSALLTGSAAAAQPSDIPRAADSLERFSIGAYGGWCANIFNAAFAVDRGAAITEAGDCGRFENGSGSAPVFGVTVEGPVARGLRWGVLAEYHSRAGSFTFPCVDPATTRLPNGTVVPALTDHIADVDYNAVVTRLVLGYQPFSFPLRISAGPALSLVMPGTYSAREQIVTPTNAEFLSGGQVLPYGTADFNAGTRFSVGLSAGISYRAKIAEGLALVPEVSGLLALSDDLSEAKLRANHVQGTLGVLYRLDRGEEAIEPPPVIAVKPETPEPRPDLDVTLTARAVDRDGATIDTVVVHQVGIISTKLYPLLTYIFFDEGSSAIPERYRRRSEAEARAFNEDALRDMNTLGIYYNLLDIIGLRMQRNAKATITVTGTQPDAAASGDKLPLANERAAQVRRYLTETWKIDPSRIAIAARAEPAARTNPETKDGQAENRRVEILSDTYEITEPLVIGDTTPRSTAPQVFLSPRATSDAGIDSWSITVNGGKKHDAIFGGSGPPPAHLQLPEDFIASATATRPDRLGMLLTVRNRAGEERSDSTTLPLKWVNTVTELRYGAGTYSLILFDFSSAQLRQEHLRTVDLVNARTETTAHASVYGYTDVLGSDELNRTLSQQRAASVATEIKAQVDEVTGRGETTLLYDNTLPEGRFYSRSVTIETKAP